MSRLHFLGYACLGMAASLLTVGTASALEVRSSAQLAQPKLAVTPETLTCTVTAGETATLSLEVRNAGGKTLAWSVSNAPAWAALAPTSGALGYSASAAVTVTVNSATLAGGQTRGQILIEAPGSEGGPARIAVTVQVKVPVAQPKPTPTEKTTTPTPPTPVVLKPVPEPRPEPERAVTPEPEAGGPKGFGIRGGAIMPSVGSTEEYASGTAFGAFWRPYRGHAKLGYEIGVSYGSAQSISGNSESTLITGSADALVRLAGGNGSGYSVYALGGVGFVREDATHTVLGETSATAAVVDLGLGATFAAHRFDVRAAYSLLAGSENVEGLMGVTMGYVF